MLIAINQMHKKTPLYDRIETFCILVTWNQESMQVADEGIVANFTELPTSVIQVQRPDKSSSKVVSF